MKEYLGDGVYVDHDGHAWVLTTENGVSITNTILLEPEVLNALFRYVKERQTSPEKHTAFNCLACNADRCGVLWP